MNVAIIPARGGSKRIPRKNLKDFCGQPIIRYSIDAARASGVFDRVIVSTDDEEIAAYARAAGAETPFMRPASLADDHATTVPVIAHAIEQLSDVPRAELNACCIYATAPFIRSQDLRAARDLLVNQRVGGYVFTAASFPFPIQRAFRVDAQQRVSMFDEANYGARSQDLEPAYQDAGQFYWGAATTYLERKIFFSQDSRALVLPRYRVQDIDTADDWRRAELVYQSLKSTGEVA